MVSLDSSFSIAKKKKVGMRAAYNKSFSLSVHYNLAYIKLRQCVETNAVKKNTFRNTMADRK